MPQIRMAPKEGEAAPSKAGEAAPKKARLDGEAAPSKASDEPKLEPKEPKDEKEDEKTPRKKKAGEKVQKRPAEESVSSSKGKRAPESKGQKNRRKDLMSYKRSREATGTSFEDGNNKKMPEELKKQCDDDPLAFFEVWREAQGNYSTVMLTLSKKETKKTHRGRQREWMDEDDLLTMKCKGNRIKFESMKRKLTKLGRSRINPDMESDTEGNLQFKPLTKDADSSHSEDEIVSDITATGSGSANKDSLHKQIQSQGLTSRTKKPKAPAGKEKQDEEQNKSKEKEEEERRQDADKVKKDAEKARKKEEPLERGKSWMFKLPPLLRDIDGLLKEMSSKAYKVAVPEKYLKEFEASLKSAKAELLAFRIKFEKINSVQDCKQYAKKSTEFLVEAEGCVESSKKSVKAARSTFSVYLNGK